MKVLSVGLIGFGRSGGRFLRAVIHRQREIGDVSLEAVCDSNKSRLSFLQEFGIKIYSDYLVMLSSNHFDIIIISTNEDSHFQILNDIKKYHISFKRILVEKLLVETMEQAVELKKMYKEDELAVHFVERHSPIVKNVLDWMCDNNLNVKRATFFWGKYRLHDHRPTVGVTSEISHPIDLVLLLARVKNNTKFEVLNSCDSYSDYSYSGEDLLDSISANIKFENGLVINANSSFLWDGRERRVILFLSDNTGIVKYIVTMIFDNPHWDMDSCVVYDVGISEGRRTVVKEWKINKEDIDSGIFCISKTSRFLGENIEEVLGKSKSIVLSRINEACYIQKIVTTLENNAPNNASHTHIFSAKEANSIRSADCDDALYKFLKREMLEDDVIEWDKEF